MPVFRPTVDLTVAYGGLGWSVRALIDTGAPVTILDRGAADALGIDFEKRPRRLEKHQLAGREHWAQVERVTLKLAPFHDLQWQTDVGFLVDDWSMPFGGLLGSQGFLDRWVVTFSAGENYFIVEEPESFTGRLPTDMAEEFERRDQGFRGP